MKFYIDNLIKKYMYAPIEIKATVWYTMGNIIQKISPWLVIVVLTHYLTTEEYGKYTIFMSWMEIFEIVITLRIYGNNYIVGIVRNDEQKKLYTATIQSLGFLLIAGWLIIYIILHKWINMITNIDTNLSILMICSFMGNICFGLWSSRQRVDNRYQEMLAAIFFYGLLGPILGALTVIFDIGNPVLHVVLVRTGIQLGVAVPFFISNYNGTKMKWDKVFAIDALKCNIPLMPYYLSMILLSHIDRFMIQRIKGYSDAAVYSVAYSASMMVFVISGALNLSLQTWLFKELKNKNNTKNKSNFITLGAIVIAFFCFFELSLAPDIIRILGGEKYTAAIWVMPPLTLNVIIMYIYQQYVNILFYYKRIRSILGAAMFSVICNIFLNAMFIPDFGYIAGGYTSLASYLLVMVLYQWLVNRECAKEGIDLSLFFNKKRNMGILIISIFFAFFIMYLYDKPKVRYIIITLMGIFFLCTRKQWAKDIRVK